MTYKQKIETVSNWLQTADHVLIGAGSGLSAAAGLNYGDTEAFARLFPGMVKRGFTAQYQLVGYSDWTPALKWGYLAANVDAVRFNAPPHPVYGRLLDLVRRKDYFVMTTNVDGMFPKNGFADDRMYTPQGDYALIQCQTPCSTDTWLTRPYLDRILPTIDRETQEVTDPDVLPHCPNCGEDMMMNVRGGNWFVEAPYEEQYNQFVAWVNTTVKGKLLVFDIGSGFNTPSVVRWPMEKITYQHPNANLVRINMDDAHVPEEIADASVSLQGDAMQIVSDVWEAVGNSY